MKKKASPVLALVLAVTLLSSVFAPAVHAQAETEIPLSSGAEIVSVEAPVETPDSDNSQELPAEGEEVVDSGNQQGLEEPTGGEQTADSGNQQESDEPSEGEQIVDFGNLPELSADTAEKPFITKISFTNFKGEPLGKDVDKAAEVRIRFDFELPNGHNVKKGDTYGLQIPPQIDIVNEMDFLLLDKGDLTVANVHISKDGKAVITFTDYVEKYSNVSGFFFINTQFDEEEIGNETPVEIKFQVEGKSEPYIVEVEFKQDGPTMTKKGDYNKTDGTITWTVVVNPDKMTVNNAVFTDDILAGMTYVQGTAKITPAIGGKNFEYASSGQVDSGSAPSKTGTLTYVFPEKIQDTYTITFNTKVTADYAFKLENEASLAYGDSKTIKAKAEVTRSVNFIRKTGAIIKQGTEQYIEWTIEVNPDSYKLTKAKIRDIIPDGLVLVNETVKVTREGTAVESPVYTYDEGSNTFSYTFNGEITKPCKVVFHTKASDPNYYKGNGKRFKNIATLTTDEDIPEDKKESGYEIGLPSNVIKKEGEGYDPATQEISWKITINANKIDIAGAVVTDEIPDDQEFVAGSANIDKLGTGSFTKIPDGNANTLEYTFNTGAENNDTYVITFKTRVKDEKLTSGNSRKTYYNDATIEINGVKTTDKGDRFVESKVFEKKGASYDYTTKEITWKITVNQNGMPLKNVVVTDTIPEKTEFVIGSVLVGEQPATPSASAPPTAGTYFYDTESKTLTYNFGNINKEMVLTFKTRISDHSLFATNEDIPIKNTARLTHSLHTDEISSEDSQTVKNSIVSKKSTTQNASKFIDWEVTINSNKIKLTEAKLTDTLQEGLALDKNSVKLYEMELNANGELSQGSQIYYPLSSVKYNADTREIIFPLPNGIEKALLLTFRTNITDKSKSPFTNEISFAGQGQFAKSSSGSVKVLSQGGGGGATGESGSIKVIKVDANNVTRVLSGAEFELLDKDKNPIDFAVTGEDGSVVFKQLLFDVDYSIREVTAPAGYQLSSEVYEFQVHNSTDQKNITYQYKNTKIPTSGRGGGDGGKSGGGSSYSEKEENPRMGIDLIAPTVYTLLVLSGATVCFIVNKKIGTPKKK